MAIYNNNSQFYYTTGEVNASFERLGTTYLDYRDNTGSSNSRGPLDYGEGGDPQSDGGMRVNVYEDFENSDEYWRGSYYDENEGEWEDFTFFGSEEELDDWLNDEGYIDDEEDYAEEL